MVMVTILLLLLKKILTQLSSENGGRGGMLSIYCCRVIMEDFTSATPVRSMKERGMYLDVVELSTAVLLCLPFLLLARHFTQYTHSTPVSIL